MGFFAGLVSMYLLAWALSFVWSSYYTNTISGRGIFAAAVMFIMIGITHFAKPEKLEAMMPETWKYKRALNYISGAAEVILGALLFFEKTRIYAAWGLLLLLVCVFPANIYKAKAKPNAYNISRLFFQPIYMIWIWNFCM